jgi:hypothetical protein
MWNSLPHPQTQTPSCSWRTLELAKTARIDLAWPQGERTAAPARKGWGFESGAVAILSAAVGSGCPVLSPRGAKALKTMIVRPALMATSLQCLLWAIWTIWTGLC